MITKKEAIQMRIDRQEDLIAQSKDSIRRLLEKVEYTRADIRYREGLVSKFRNEMSGADIWNKARDSYMQEKKEREGREWGVAIPFHGDKNG